jgi:hypothetical protein
VFTVPSEQAGVGNPPPLPIPSFADSVVTVVPATIQSDDPDDPVGWGIDNADSLIDGNGNIQVTARIVANGDGATIFRVAYHAVILGCPVRAHERGGRDSGARPPRRPARFTISAGQTRPFALA